MSQAPYWLRPRDAAELERERRHLEALKWMERLAILFKRNVRPKQP
jgi:hypothetical protein